jgi:hypothetical protein
MNTVASYQEIGNMDDATVGKIVDRLGDDCFEAHRGAFWWDEASRVAVAFGNDGYAQDVRARSEVAAVRRLLAEDGGEELAFATDEDGYSWALACKLPAGLVPDVLEGILWLVWNELSDRRWGPKGNDCDVALDSIDWGDLREVLRTEGWSLTGLQVNIAGMVLERNGLI